MKNMLGAEREDGEADWQTRKDDMSGLFLHGEGLFHSRFWSIFEDMAFGWVGQVTRTFRSWIVAAGRSPFQNDFYPGWPNIKLANFSQ
jgi:hypothetical protein